MSNINFSRIAKKYENNSLVQKSAAETLLTLLEIQDNENILDIGCGTGNITKNIRKLTKGKVVGVDISTGMIEKAKEINKDSNIVFQVGNINELEFNNEFNVVFCNSTFQWFNEPEGCIQNFYKALTKGGRVGIQAPAQNLYCPNFIVAIEGVKNDKRTKNIFDNFESPWFFLETAEAYGNLFRTLGFKIIFSQIDKVISRHSPEEVFKIFSSGAIAGYLNQDYYSENINEEYVENFKEIVNNSFKQQADAEGYVELVFNRIFLVAVKE